MDLKSLFIVLFVLFNHGVADFLLQNKNMALNKSSSNYWLSIHVFYYTIGMMPTSLLL